MKQIKTPWMRRILFPLLLALLAGGLFMLGCRQYSALAPATPTEPPEETLSPEAVAQQAAREAAEAEERRRQGLLDDALKAQAEGRLEEALELAKSSGLRPELVEEIEHQIMKAADDALAAQAREALEALDLKAALALGAQLTDPEARETLLRELNEGWTGMLPRLRETYGNALSAGAWYSLVAGDAPPTHGG